MTTYDVVVVGGGLIGKAIALRTARSQLTTVLIDPSEKPHGVASLAAGAMLGAFGEVSVADSTPDSLTELRFRVEAARLYPRWLDEIQDCGGQRVALRAGTFVVANMVGADDRRSIRVMAEQLARFGERHEWVEPADVPGLKPARQHQAVDAMFLPDEACVDTSVLMRSLDSALAATDRVRRLDDVATGLIVRGERVVGVSTARHGEVSAGQVVVACGIGTDRLVESAGWPVPVMPRQVVGKGAALLMRGEAAIPHVIRTPNRDFACGMHVVPREDGLTYVGATNRVYSEPIEHDGVMGDEIHYLLDSAIHEINTDLRLGRIEQLLFGSRPVSVDRRPIVGATGLNGLQVATGTYRNGVLMAPLIAEIVTAGLIGAESPYANPFSPHGRGAPDEAGIRAARAIDLAMPDLVSFLQEPGGRLPYNRQQELEDFLWTLARLALTDDPAVSALGDQLRAVLQTYPVPEMVPELFYRAHFARRAGGRAQGEQP